MKSWLHHSLSQWCALLFPQKCNWNQKMQDVKNRSQWLTFIKLHLHHDAVLWAASLTGAARLPCWDPREECDPSAVGGRPTGASGQPGEHAGTAHTCPDCQSHHAFLQLLFQTGWQRKSCTKTHLGARLLWTSLVGSMAMPGPACDLLWTA